MAERFPDERIFQDALNRIASETKPEDKLAVLDTLHESLRERHDVMRYRLQYAADVSKEAYQHVYEEYQRLYPKDVFANLLEFHMQIECGQHEDALKVIDRIDADIGGDPYLDALRAKARFCMKDWKNSKALGERAVRAEPKLPQAYDTLLGIAIIERDRNEMFRCLDTLADLGEDLSYMDKELLSGGFAAATYGEWKAQRNRRLSTTRPGGFKFD